MEKLNFLGAGPKIGMVALPYLAAAIILSAFLPELFSFGQPAKSPLLIIGIIFLAVGLIFYAFTVRLLLGGLKNTKLVTSGPYSLCRNPLYVAILLFIIPAIAFLMNSWLVLTTIIPGYIAFKLVIKNEYAEMEKFFGEEWTKYKEKTPEFFPFPLKKWFG